MRWNFRQRWQTCLLLYQKHSLLFLFNRVYYLIMTHFTLEQYLLIEQKNVNENILCTSYLNSYSTNSWKIVKKLYKLYKTLHDVRTSKTFYLWKRPKPIKSMTFTIFRPDTIWHILRKDLDLYVYKIQFIQELKSNDHLLLIKFLDWIFEQLINDQNFY